MPANEFKVNTYAPPWDTFKIRLEKCRTLMGGTETLRSLSETYLPRNEIESPKNYGARLKRSVLFNGYRKTVEDFCGRVFRNPVVLSDDVNEQFKQWSKSISFQGEALTDFGERVFTDGLQAGISYVYVETPVVKDQLNLEQEESLNVRPYFVHIPAERILGWKSSVLGGRTVLNQVRIFETVSDTSQSAYNEFKDTPVNQVRVLERNDGFVSSSIYREDSKGDWVIVESNYIDIDEIPLVPFYASRHSFMAGKPPLEDLADLNIRHWQSDSDLSNTLRYVANPILFGKGFGETKELMIANSSAILMGDSEADLKYVELQGNSVSSVSDYVSQLEFRMEAMGLQLLVVKGGPQTATGEIRNETKEMSKLGMMAARFEEALENCYVLASKLSGVEWSPGSIKVNSDLTSFDLSPGVLNLLLGAVNSGKISVETFWDEMRRRGLLMDTFDPELESERLKLEEDRLMADEIDFDKE